KPSRKPPSPKIRATAPRPPSPKNAESGGKEKKKDQILAFPSPNTHKLLSLPSLTRCPSHHPLPAGQPDQNHSDHPPSPSQVKSSQAKEI
ncbi:hypothetical protein COCVIDRAFT_101927, partial [Bipolaris victoriae FI3]